MSGKLIHCTVVGDRVKLRKETCYWLSTGADIVLSACPTLSCTVCARDGPTGWEGEGDSTVRICKFDFVPSPTHIFGARLIFYL